MTEQKSSPEQQLLKAVQKKDVSKIKDILMTGVEINAFVSVKSRKTTALHMACQKKSLKIVNLLIKCNADVQIQEFPSGRTPLHIASMYAAHKIVKVLLDNGANPVAEDNDGKNPMNLIGSKYPGDTASRAIIDGKSECQVLLLEAGSIKMMELKEQREARIKDVESGLQGLKIESNARIKQIEKAQEKVEYYDFFFFFFFFFYFFFKKTNRNLLKHTHI